MKLCFDCMTSKSDREQLSKYPISCGLCGDHIDKRKKGWIDLHLTPGILPDWVGWGQQFLCPICSQFTYFEKGLGIDLGREVLKC